ncbi:MAG TPA: dihydrolipoamide acetyltransferase family protein [Streptosporangiaceae bacterium]|nr:dihydrolipoamide acetyltransferase family protein [Streptosporangiaceae bacterium]
MQQFRLPDVGEGLTEAEIVRWHVQPGDQVTVNQIIVEIETAKAVVELPCPWAGTVDALLVPEGATVDVGTPIIAVNTSPGASSAGSSPGSVTDSGGAEPGPGVDDRPAALAEDLVPAAAASPEPAGDGAGNGAAAPAAPPERQAVLVGYGVKLGPTTRRPRKKPAAVAQGTAAPAAAPATGAPEPAAAAAAVPQEPAGRVSVLAKPPVRKLARDRGVDLATVTGTGPGNTVTREDVLAAADAPQAPATLQAPAAPAADPGVREERIPIRGVRKHTAAAVLASAFTAPHVTEFLQIDITETMSATERLKALPDFAEVRVSPLLLVARALLTAVARNPMINARWDEASQEIVVPNYVNLGIAASTSRGLMVPNIKDAHALSLPGLARALNELTQTARAGKTTPAGLAGGTITITNVGVFGVDSGTPILTPGEAAILAFGRVREAPWVHEGQLAVRQVTTLALSFDHRVVDGDLGSAVLTEVGAMLTDPLRMLAWG